VATLAVVGGVAASAASTSGSGSPPPPPPPPIIGTVTTVATSGFDVSTPKHTTVDVTTTTSTTYLEPGTDLTPTGVAVGEQVNVEVVKPSGPPPTSKTSTTPANPVARQVAIVLPSVQGTVASVSGSTFVVAPGQGHSVEVTVSSSTEYFKGTSSATYTDVVKGAAVGVLGTFASSTDTGLDAIAVHIGPPPPPPPGSSAASSTGGSSPAAATGSGSGSGGNTASGSSQSSGDHSSGDQPSGGQPSGAGSGPPTTSGSGPSGSSTGGSSSTPPGGGSSTTSGSSTSSGSTSSGSTTSGSTTSGSTVVLGTVTSISGDTIVVDTASGTATVQFSSSTTFVNPEGPTTSAALAVGEHVRAEGTESDGVLVATTICVAGASSTTPSGSGPGSGGTPSGGPPARSGPPTTGSGGSDPGGPGGEG